MKQLTQEAAFKDLLTQPDFKKDFSPQTRHTYKKRLELGKLLSGKTMEKLLLKYGYEIVSERKWTKR